MAKNQQPKLNYRFHDPNPPGVAADFLVKLFVEVNKPKAEAAIREAADKAALAPSPRKSSKRRAQAKIA